YRHKDVEGPLPTIFLRTPYNFNEAGERRLKAVTHAVERGYAYVIQNERGKFFSEGEWEILGFPRTDGYDTLDWIAAQEWSNGRVGTIGCSSSAEWQLALAAMDHPAHAAMVPMAAGAGIGRVGTFYEQGNWYRGGVYQMLFSTWLYWVQNTQRPRLPEGLPREDVVRLSRYFDLAPDMPDVDWPEQIKHLPLVTMMQEVEGPEGMYAEFIQRLPDDPTWYNGGLYHDDEPWGVPALWMNSWYDISQGPNLALFNHIRQNAEDPEVRDGQYVVIAPTPHCRFQTDKKKTLVGERDMGDVRFEYEELTDRWFGYWLKGEQNDVLADTPRVQYYTMGLNQWQSADTWPPDDVELVTWYLASDGAANSLFGDGRLESAPSATDAPDRFSYDPTIPLPSLGGGVCCNGGAVEPGVFDQRGIEARHDVLVYTSEPLAQAVEVTGTIGVTLHVGSDARDTDFSVKLIDVHPDGTAYNIDETIQRTRFREGYDKQVFMEPGKVYELEVTPMSTSALIDKGHRIRVEISSSSFPRFARNLNTGGNNWEETDGVVAHNVVHHSTEYPSQIRLPIVRK
ncbi:MAG: CocE/NonD family hydrolase, partial [Deltaproteobacteria bacterium]|nr:CocE/NonD family hydrolase [Deltaproteobacteria bacterium]